MQKLSIQLSIEHETSTKIIGIECAEIGCLHGATRRKTTEEKKILLSYAHKSMLLFGNERSVLIKTYTRTQNEKPIHKLTANNDSRHNELIEICSLYCTNNGWKHARTLHVHHNTVGAYRIHAENQVTATKLLHCKINTNNSKRQFFFQSLLIEVHKKCVSAIICNKHGKIERICIKTNRLLRKTDEAFSDEYERKKYTTTEHLLFWVGYNGECQLCSSLSVRYRLEMAYK